MRSIFRNPVSYSIYFACSFLIVIGFGEAPLVVLQHLLLPYTLDISRGVGETGATMFRAIVFLAQSLVILFVLLVSNSEASGKRITLSVVGILLVFVYFLVVTFGYVVPRLH